MMAQAEGLKNMGWQVVALVAMGCCLTQAMQQRLLFPHLQDRSQQQQVQRDFYLRQVIYSLFSSLLSSFILSDF